MELSRETAETWAQWFRCLGDPSRILILNLLARQGRAMSVGEIVDQLDIGQSTVSHHLSLLADTCFVFVERRGTTSLFSINEACLDCFPSAARLVMAQPTTRGTARPPWITADPQARSNKRKRRPRTARRTSGAL